MFLVSLLRRIAFSYYDYKAYNFNIEKTDFVVIHIPDQIGDAMAIFPVIRALELHKIKHLLIVTSTINLEVFNALKLEQTKLTLVTMTMQDHATLKEIKDLAKNITLQYGTPDLCIEAMRKKNLKTMIFISQLKAKTNFQVVGLTMKCYSPLCKNASRMDQNLRTPVPMTWAFMMREAGFPAVRSIYELPLSDDVLDEVREEMRSLGSYIALNLDGSSQERTFSLSIAENLIAKIQSETDIPIVIVYGPKGEDKARALRAELESRYLDTGAAVGTIHIICNTTANIGSSSNALFSFSANSDENEQGDVMTHEISHSIGRLGDEYDKKMQGENISDTSDPDKIKWHKMLGFRGIGITAAGTETVFVPSRVCMMRDLGNPFCEVCKMELARRLNNRDYVSRQASVYVCDPEITIPHSRTGTLDRDSDQYRIDETNITKANGKDLEFRTVVQNIVDAKQHLKITFRIIGADHTVKYEKEETYTVPPHSNWYDPDAARESLSVTLPAVTGLVSGDRLEGKIIDEDTGKILADNQTAGQAWSTVTIRYMLQNEDGTETTVPDTAPATVYVPKNSAYTLRSPDLYGYTCVGNSANQGEINITEDRQEITYYYRKNSEMPEIQTVPVRVTYDGKPHTFDIQQEDGVQISYRLPENGTSNPTAKPYSQTHGL